MDQLPKHTFFARAYRKTLAYYLNQLIPKDASILEIGCGKAILLEMLHGFYKEGIDSDAHSIALALHEGSQNKVRFAKGEEFVPSSIPDYVILADTLNDVSDVQALLENIHSYALPKMRLIISCYNTVWRPLLWVATLLGLRTSQMPLNWLSQSDLKNLIELSDWEMIKQEARVLCPLPIPIIAFILNRWVAPLLPFLCLNLIMVARPRAFKEPSHRSVSVVIPARNEAGNIAAALARTPEMGLWTEFIFVEGNSTDDTWKEIQKMPALYPEKRIKILQQPGRGKGDAVRAGYAVAEGDILMILDADLTTPPEDLPKFYNAVANGSCEFANGSRLVYPMEKRAMQFCNLCANKFFGIAFSWLLGQSVKDTLCGTKVLTRENYLKIAANRSYFGNFDPFGDFDLLFGASKLNLKIRDIPVRYAERTYGTTNISRWKHGVLLLRMLGFAAKKLKFI